MSCLLPTLRRSALRSPYPAQIWRASSTAPSKKAPPPPRSSCAPSTTLTGLNYLKNQPPVVSLPDNEYPEWLWNVLKPREFGPEDEGPGGRKERWERRQKNRKAIRERNFMSTQ